jgi:hypothetical protein
MEENEIIIRVDVCKDCSRVCSVRDTINHADPCAECPFKVWNRHGSCNPEEPVTGLGDLVHKIALPVGRAVHWPCVDPATQELRPTSPCAKAQKWLNEKVPFGHEKPRSG